MHIEQHLSLSHLTTWHIPYLVRYFVRITSVEDLLALTQHPIYQDPTIPKIILGKGANSLFTTTEIDALVISIDIQGKQCIREDEHHSYWKVMAGEDWCDLVDFLVYEKSLAGMENLVMIPGKVGAAPIQNIAAYGQGFEDVCEEVHCLRLTTGKVEVFDKQACQFSYRNSFFKDEILKGNRDLVVIAVVIKLNKAFHPEASYESNYESLREVLDRQQIASPSVQQMSDAVKYIRSQKLPSIDDYGTNGSLFMNPVVDGLRLKKLLHLFPKLQFYPTEKMQHKKLDIASIEDHAHYKIAAGHILESLGWRYKGEDGKWHAKIVHQVGVWHGHSLILVNYGTKNPQDIIDYIHRLQESFRSATGIDIVPEINIV